MHFKNVIDNKICHELVNAFYTYKILIIKEYGHREKYIVIEGNKIY